MKQLVLITLMSVALFANTFNIAVAANVSYAIDELLGEFKKSHPDTEVRVTLGSSGKLNAQIKNGAPYSMFMAANMKYPEALYSDGIATTKPVIYAQGALAYLSANPKDFSKGIDLVKDGSIEKIAVANPKTAPYGTAAVEAMQNAGVYDGVKSKLVYAESISQTVSYAITAADIGFIAKSSLYSDTMRKYVENTHWVAVDPTLYKPIDQGIVILKHGSDNPKVQALYDFMLSDKAKEIFKNYGYIVQ
jgi:molybdate transport system substrate-binding protein